ncbi:MAG TPA: cation:proton antiporter [Pseudonocardiaceae bacterium]|nr:cation:proton antiporter [Pseudonocardiaceae bacterium]
MDILLRAGHIIAALAVILVFAFAGRRAAKFLRQPPVIGEIVAGLLLGPLVVGIFGRATYKVLLPTPIFSILKLIGELGLILLLVGIAHELRNHGTRLPRRGVLMVAIGSFVPSLVLGGGIGVWLLVSHNHALRGDSPAPAFVLLVAITMAITAVPVLARILTDKGITKTMSGRLSMSAAIAMDTAGWLLLSVAVGLRSGHLSGFLKSMLVLAVGALIALGIRQLLRTEAAARLCTKLPHLMAILVAAAAIAGALAVEHLGLTSILGAVLVGLAVPVNDKAPWAKVVHQVTRVGLGLVPVFFVVTGITVLIGSFTAAPWTLFLAVIVLGVVGKVVGGFLGARTSGQPAATSMRVGALMNTRGLTELIVLQVGYSIGVLTAPLLLVLVTMAVVTTVLTGPLLAGIDRWSNRKLPIDGSFIPATPAELTDVPAEEVQAVY